GGSKFVATDQPASATQMSVTGRLKPRQRSVRTGWMNISQVNWASASTTMIAIVAQAGGEKVRNTTSGICQTAGKPTKQLSVDFIRTSAKYITPVSAISSAAARPQPGGSRPV